MQQTDANKCKHGSYSLVVGKHATSQRLTETAWNDKWRSYAYLCTGFYSWWVWWIGEHPRFKSEGSSVEFRAISPSGITHPDPWCWCLYANMIGVYWWDPWSTIYGHDMPYWWYISIYYPYYPCIIHIYMYIYIYVTYTILYGSYGHDHSIWDPQTLQQKLQGRFHHWQVVRHISCAPEDEWYHKPTSKHIMLFSSLLKNMLDYWIPTLLGKVSTCDMLWWYIYIIISYCQPH